MPDPLLKTAMEEIKAILKKHDLAAQVTLQSAGHVEYLYELSPSWSCVRLEGPLPDGAFGIRFRAKRVDFVSKEAQRKVVNASTGMLLSFRNQAAKVVDQMDGITAMLAKHYVEISHWERDES